MEIYFQTFGAVIYFLSLGGGDATQDRIQGEMIFARAAGERIKKRSLFQNQLSRCDLIWQENH